MLKKRIIPLLLLKNGRMVKGKKFSNFIDTGNPETAVKIYSSQDADELMFLDIVASIESRNILLETVSKAAKQCTMPFSVGGGIKTIEDVRSILFAGADKIVITSSIMDNPKIIEDIAKNFGSQCIIAGIDYKSDLNTKKKIVYQNCGTKMTNQNPVDYAKNLESSGVGAILLNSINNDGMMQGPSLTYQNTVDLLEKPVIFSGGYSHYLDLELLSFVYENKESKDYIRSLNGGIEGVIIGKAIYSGSIEIKKAIKALNKYAES